MAQQNLNIGLSREQIRAAVQADFVELYAALNSAYGTNLVPRLLNSGLSDSQVLDFTRANFADLYAAVKAQGLTGAPRYLNAGLSSDQLRAATQANFTDLYTLLGLANIHGSSQMLVALGQSAMVAQGISGSSGLPSGWADTSRVQMWNGSAFATYSPAAAANWGPEVPYAKAWLDANPTGTLYIVKSAVGNTQLGAISTYGAANGATQDWSVAGTLYPPAKTAILAAKATFTAPVNVTALWIQGETDAMASNLATDYQTNLAALFARLRSDFGANKIIYSTANESRAWLYKDQIISAQIANESSLDKCITGDNLALQSDHWHWTAPSVNSIGAALFTGVSGPHTATRTNTLSGITENCDPLITVSNGYLTATQGPGGSGNGCQVIGKRGAASGKKFFSARVGAVAPSAGLAIGFVSHTFSVASTWFGSDNTSVCLYGNGNAVFGGAAALTGLGSVAAGDLLQARIDLDARTAAFQINNNGWSANLDVSAMTGTVYPALGMLGAGESLTIDNSLTPPSGFSYFGG